MSSLPAPAFLCPAVGHGKQLAMGPADQQAGAFLSWTSLLANSCLMSTQYTPRDTTSPGGIRACACMHSHQDRPAFAHPRALPAHRPLLTHQSQRPEGERRFSVLRAGLRPEGGVPASPGRPCPLLLHSAGKVDWEAAAPVCVVAGASLRQNRTHSCVKTAFQALYLLLPSHACAPPGPGD